MPFAIGSIGLEQVCYPRAEFYDMMRELIRFDYALNGMYLATFIGIGVGILIGIGYMRHKHGLE